ncbi:hypothetical protein V5O48_000432 [Marasmius crinis-equi]|uniref:F-box domain-containing protein n=1 Tax=Marasmius crinis-equi TaxID=585013 RepID=A0ABR3G1A1_9AGAR
MSTPNMNERVPFSATRISEMRELFRSTITSSDCNVISQFLLDAEMEMRRCDDEMKRLKTAMLMLENKKKDLEGVVDKCRSLLAPVHRLPNEVLTRVLSLTRGMEYALEPSVIPTSVALSMVCGRWRDVMLSTPGLWSDLHIEFALWKGKFPVLERLVRIFMQRSGLRPLVVRMDLRDINNFMEGHDDILPIINILFHHCARWQRLALGNYSQWSSLLWNRRERDFPALEALQILWNNSLPSVAHTLFKGSPSLKRFEVGSLDVFGNDEHLKLPLRQIEFLTVRKSSASATLKFLSSFPQLKELKLMQCGGHLGDYTGQYISDTVNSASFTWKSQEDADTILRRLTLPQLTSLTMGCPWQFEWTPWVGSSATDFLARSACTITSLCLDRLPMADRQVIALLELMPALANLEINEAPAKGKNKIITATFIRRLVVNPHATLFSARPFLSRLTSLVLITDKEGLVEQDIFNAVSSRWIPDPEQAREVGVGCLRSVRLTARRGDADHSRLSILECFRVVGLQMDIFYEPL